ncbi:hypothetical protein Pint_31100 [Pistacia integerrima]|uniref:Uncharacterized protein n=1 Tax=Pistacia integerrima TaxID=434235 RepID=A0ACC0XMG0_9ROSI|nr:hypothetical protein Pint_31100 [Pistacia integerrima]
MGLSSNGWEFFLWVSHQMDGNKSVKESVPSTHLSAVQPFHRPSVIGSQDYDIIKHGTSVGSPEVHLSAKLQVTGEAEYTDDTPPLLMVCMLRDNTIGPVVYDKELFASEVVTCVGQDIGVVVADTHEKAKLAARRVHIEYEELPAILSIQDAIEAKSFHPNRQKSLNKGDVGICFQSGQCDTIIEGEVHVGGQEHFYLVPHSSFVWTMDGGNELHMISSTQMISPSIKFSHVRPQKHQKYVAHVLGLLMSKVVGFTNEGKVMALDLEIYNNAGNSLDLSLMLEIHLTYLLLSLNGLCFTRTMSMRYQTFEFWEGPEEIREINFQGEGSITHYGQKFEFCTLAPLWNELKVSCDFLNARKEAEIFNLNNRWKKRGVAMVPTKFGISFRLKLMNQLTLEPYVNTVGALVHVYTDGTVLVTHGGVEMGQGLHTKVAQVAASAFNIPLSSVFISETSTDKVPNASPTAASASSDMYGAAVLDACEQIKARMEPIASKNNFTSFAECMLCRKNNLSAHGFYITPEIGFDWNVGKGTPFGYFTYGAASAEVEIDTLTRDFHTRAANVILDLGYSLNPACK